MHKMPVFSHFLESGKIGKSSLIHSKVLIFNIFVNREKFGSTAQDKHLKISILELWTNWEKLSFTFCC